MLHDLQAYEVERDGHEYRVEVEIIENTEEYVLVIVGVNDGRRPASITSEASTFISKKPLA